MNTFLVPEEHRVRIRPQPILDSRFDQTEEAISHLFDAQGIYPFGLSSSGMDVDVFKLWFAWCRKGARMFAPESLPWVPVGKAGPILLMGHCHPGKAEAPILPQGLFQPVLLTAQAYNQQLRAMSVLHAEVTANNYEAPEFVLPSGWPTRVKCRTNADALRFIVTQMIVDKADHQSLCRLAERDEIPDHDLPSGYRSAIWFLRGLGSIVDLTSIKAPGEMLALIPEPLRKRITPVHQAGKLVFFATPELDHAHIEDHMLASMLGEGWRLRFIMHDGVRTNPDMAESADDTDKVFVGGSRPNEAKAEVTIEIDAKKYDRYDARASKAEPKDVFFWLLNTCLRDEISDLHIEPGLPQARARIRREGNLVEILGMNDAFCRTLVASAKSLVAMRSEMFEPQDGQFSVRRGDVVVNVRVSAMPIRKAYQSLVFRFLPRRSRTVQLDNLEQPAHTLQMLKHAITRPQGLVLVCGPTGSGKTTTLYACLGMLNTPDMKIVTAEDPIEYEVEGIMQAAVDRPRGVNFERLVETQLRQDPDICLIGEIRSRESAEVAMQLALTGHLVFATLHTLSSSKAIRRLLDLGVNNNVLTEALLLVQSQRLTSRLCPKCREAHPMTLEEHELFRKHGVEVHDAVSYRPNPQGCSDCRQTGYKGRIAIMDLLPITEEIQELIFKGGDSREIDRIARERKFPSMVQEALKHALIGNITLSDALIHEAAWAHLEGAREGDR